MSVIGHVLRTAPVLLAVSGLGFTSPLSAQVEPPDSATSELDTAAGLPAEFPFRVGELAEYDVTFGPIRVGRAKLEIEGIEEVHGTASHRLSMEVDGRIPLYRLDDRTVSWLAAGPYRSLRFEQVLHQGSYRRHRRWEMDHEALTTTREDWDEELEEYRAHRRQRDLPIPPGALDEVSYLYLMRLLPLEVGRVFRFDRYFEEDGNPVIIEVLRRERVRVKAGSFDTFVVRPIIQTDGIFGDGGEAEVFISDDDRRVIVQLRTKMTVGSLDMFLSDYDPGGEASDGP